MRQSPIPSRAPRRLLLCGILLAALVAPLLALTPAQAATLTVTTTDDSGPGSLRQAIADAAPGDTITFALPNPSVITLSSELVIAQNLTITGPGAAALTISGNNATRVFFINPGAPGATSGPPAASLSVAISDLTIANGKAKGFDGGTSAAAGGSGGAAGLGGAIFSNNSSLALTNVVFSANQAQGGSGSGAAASFFGAAGGAGVGSAGAAGVFEGGAGGSGGALGGTGGTGGTGGIYTDGDGGAGTAGGEGAGGGGGGIGANCPNFSSCTGPGSSGGAGGRGGFGGGGGGGGATGYDNSGIPVGGDGGAGGFGGGGGGGGGSQASSGWNVGGRGGAGGSFGGAGSPSIDSRRGGGGGGGAGLGGALFLRAGSLTLGGSTFVNNGAAGGAGGLDDSGTRAGSGQGKGGALFVNGGVTVSGCAGFSGNTATNAAGSGTDTADVYGGPVPACDSTPPVITPNVAGTLGSNGWYVSDVTLTWTVSDPESTIAGSTGCAPQTITADTAGVTFTCSATSAGGLNSSSITLKRDATRPSVASGTADRRPNDAGWYNAPVTVSFAGTDATSGIAACTTGAAYSGPDSAAASVAGTCTDNAGNTSTPVSFALKYDATAPTITAAAKTDPNGGGWYNGDVTVTFTCLDNLSGVVSCPADQVLSSEGTAVSSTAQAIVDNAGNSSAPSNVVTVKIDKSAPVLGACPAAAPFAFNSGVKSVGPIAVNADISGLNAAASTLTGAVDTSSAGSKSVTFTATDNAGNVATQLCTYLVNAPPTITVTTNGSACLSDSSAKGVISLVLADADGGPQPLTLSVVGNSNTALVPNSGVQLGGSGANRTLTVTAAAKKSGTALLTLRVSDGLNTTDLPVNVVVGTDRNETLNGTANTDMIFGLLGANTINGLGGNDLLCGGNGVDTINGGEGSDSIYGNRGDDVFTGGPGADFFSGGPGFDTVTDFTPGQGDTKDSTVEKVTTITAAGTPEIVARLFLPAVQH